jgi:hypothetical protein
MRWKCNERERMGDGRLAERILSQVRCLYVDVVFLALIRFRGLIGACPDQVRARSTVAA